MSNNTQPTGSLLARGRFGDIDEYIASLNNWDLSITQLVSGQSQCGQLFLSVGDFEYLFFDHALKSLHHAHQVKPGISFLIPLSKEPLNYLEQHFDEPTICCAPYGESITVITPDDFVGATVYISNDKLHELLEQRYDSPVCCPPRYTSTFYHPSVEQLSQLQKCLHTVYQHFQKTTLLSADNEHWLSEISSNYMMPLLNDIMANQQNQLLKHRPDAFKQALEIIFAHLDSPPSITEMAQQLKMTPRNLQYLFKNHLGMTPKQFIKALRLNAARKKLWHAQFKRGKIADIANSLGYWHMGSFAQDFKSLFQLNPTDILRTGNNASLFKDDVE